MSSDISSADETAHLSMLMALLPPNARLLVEAECRDGALAQRYRRAYPASFYFAVERSPERAALARRHAPVVHQANLDAASDAFFEHLSMADGWIFDTALERLRDPVRVLARIRASMPIDACIVARVVNGDYWGGPATPRDAEPEHRYTLQALLDLMAAAGLRLVAGVAVTPKETPDPEIEAALRAQAGAAGLDPEQAWQDALPTHYLIKAVPA